MKNTINRLIFIDNIFHFSMKCDIMLSIFTNIAFQKETMKSNQSKASIDNIYTLDGRVPLLKSIPFGLQHVLAMFVANIAPIMIVTVLVD